MDSKFACVLSGMLFCMLVPSRADTRPGPAAKPRHRTTAQEGHSQPDGESQDQRKVGRRRCGPCGRRDPRARAARVPARRLVKGSAVCRARVLLQNAPPSCSGRGRRRRRRRRRKRRGRRERRQRWSRRLRRQGRRERRRRRQDRGCRKAVHGEGARVAVLCKER